MAEHTAGLLEAERQTSQMGPWWNLTGAMIGRTGVVADTLNRDHILDPDEDEANARRLVACWNALSGIPTKVVEEAFSAADMGAILQRWDQTEPAMQRRILVAFVNKMIAAQKDATALAEVCAEVLDRLDTLALYEFNQRWEEKLRERAREIVAKHRATAGQ